LRGIDNGNTIKVLHIDMEVDRSVEAVFGEFGEQNDLKNK
jgi:hypothetical protein